MLHHNPQPITPEAQALLRVAEQDWKTVELLAQHTDAPVSSLCFHAQQYLEKVMKAVLVSNAVIFRRTHDLEVLAALLAEKEITLPLSIDQLKQLNPFAVTLRYGEVDFPLLDVPKVLEMMHNARVWVEKHIGYQP